MEVLQRICIGILNPMYRITTKIPEKIRMNIVGISFFVIILFFYSCYSSPKFCNFTYDYSTKGFINLIPLSAIIVFSINGALHKVKYNRALCVCWFVFGGMLLIWEVVLDMGYGFIPFIISVLVFFPCLYFVWENRGDYYSLFDLIAKAVVVSMILFFIVCIVCFPITGGGLRFGRYCGSTGNPNNLGMITASAVTCSLYLIYTHRKYGVLYMIICAVSVSLCVFSAARTSFLSIIMQFIIFILFCFKYQFSDNEKIKTAIKVVLLLVIVLSAIPINKALISNNVLDSAINSQFIYAYEKDNDDNMDHELNEENEKLISVTDRFSMNQKDKNSISSGRINIWKAYIEHIDFRGHDVQEKFLVDDTTGSVNSWAHNIFLELSYRGGLLSGLLYLIIVLYTVIYSFKCFFLKRYYTRDCIFTVLATASFCIISMLEMATFPLERDYILLYYIAISPLFFKRKEIGNE